MEDVTWAPGATQSGALGRMAWRARTSRPSRRRRESIVRLPPADERRQRSHVRRAAGPIHIAPVTELALFPIAGKTASVFLVNENYPRLGGVITWHQMGATASTPTCS